MFPAFGTDSIPGQNISSDLDQLGDSLVDVQAELAHWETLNFSFDMDDKQNADSRSLPEHSSAGHSGGNQPGQTNQQARPDPQDAALLAHFSAAAATNPSSGQQVPLTVEQAYANFLQAVANAQGGDTRFQGSPYNPSQLPPGFPANYFSSPSPVPQPASPQSNAYWNQGYTPYNMNYLSPQASHGYSGQQLPPLHQNYPTQSPFAANTFTSPLTAGPGPSSSSSSASPSTYTSPNLASTSTRAPSSAPDTPQAGQTEAEAAGSNSDDKRRRNTAASARFRIKKKQRTLNLERSVSDLTGRAEELEREAADLRRENGWLKEIVMLKGSRFAAAPGGANVPQEPTFTMPGPSTPRASSDGASGDEEQGDGDDSSDEDYTEGRKKKKGKRRS